MTQQVNGDIPLIYLDGTSRYVKHGADGVNKTASLVVHHSYSGRVGHRSFLSGFENRSSTSPNDVAVISDTTLSSSQEKMFELNRWRIIPPVTEAKESFFKLLILRGLSLGRQQYDPVSLQTAVNHVFANKLFVDVRNSKTDRISMLTTGGPSDHVRVVKKLQQAPFFADYLRDSLRRHPGGVLGGVYVRLYDNELFESTPKRRRLALPKALKLAFAEAKLKRISEKNQE